MYPPFRSPCPVASTLDVLGDRWSLVVLRTMFAGGRRFQDFEAAAEKIAGSTLADRLLKLEEHGLIYKAAYQMRPVRYEYRLTRRGADTLPILQAMAAWGGQHIPDRWEQPGWFRDSAPSDFYPTG